MAVSPALQLLNRATRRSVRRWKFSLHESLSTLSSLPDLGPQNRVRWLHKARGRRVELILNRPGSVSFNVPTKSEEGRDIFGYELVRCIVAWAEDKNGVFQPIWSGPIYTAQAQEPSGKINVTCVGWEELLEHRELRTDVNFNKVSNEEMARCIINTANNQYANDGYGSGGVAEDLLYGAGDFEDSGTWELGTTQVWAAVGQVGIGDFPIQTPGVTPAGIQGWQDCPPSGSHWFRTRFVKTTTSPGVYYRRVYIKSKQGVTIDNGVVGTPEAPAIRAHPSGFTVEPSTNYTVSGMFRGTQRTFGNGIAVSSLSTNIVTVGVGISWHDANGFWLGTSSESGVISNSSFMEWTNMTEFTKTFTSPSNAVYAGVYIYVLYGNGHTNTIDILWDNIICTKASDPGKRRFPLQGGFEDAAYILNQMSDASMETGSQWSSWAAYPAGDASLTRTQSVDWHASGAKSLQFRYGLVASSGETGLRYTWINGPGSTFPGDPIYFRVPIRIVANGSNGTQARWSLKDASGVIGYQATSQLLTGGAQEGVLEVYVPAVPSTPGYNRMTLEVFSNALAGDFVMWYIDDITLVEDHPPVPFYEGSQQSARYYDLDAFARGMRSMGPVFTRTYTRGTKLAQILREMTEIEWGIDYTIEPLTRRLNTWWDLIMPGTSLRGYGQDRPDVVFGYNTAPHNVAEIDEVHDASRMKNRVNTQGKVGWGLAQELDSIDKYGIHEETIPLTDVADPPPPQPSILAVYAGAEVAMFGYPFQLFTFKPKKYISGSTVPMFGVDYGLGDLTRLRSDGDVIKIAVPGEDKGDNPPTKTLIDNFNRTVNQPVESGAGSTIWSTAGFSTATNGLKINTTQQYASAEATDGNGLLLGQFGPDWDFYMRHSGWMDFFWGQPGSGLVMGTDYHRFRMVIDNTSFGPGDTFNIDGKNILTGQQRFFSPFYVWLQKRGTSYKLFRKEDLKDPWQFSASFTVPQIPSEIGPHSIGVGFNTTSANSGTIEDLSGGTYVPPSYTTVSDGKVMRVFGATISIDDNTDGETIDTLTTALAG